MFREVHANGSIPKIFSLATTFPLTGQRCPSYWLYASGSILAPFSRGAGVLAAPCSNERLVSVLWGAAYLVSLVDRAWKQGKGARKSFEGWKLEPSNEAESQ